LVVLRLLVRRRCARYWRRPSSEMEGRGRERWRLAADGTCGRVRSGTICRAITSFRSEPVFH
jgi:hypothetical protein